MLHFFKGRECFPRKFFVLFQQASLKGSAKKSPLRGDNPIALALTRFVFLLSGSVLVCVFMENVRVHACVCAVDIEWEAQTARCHWFLCPTLGLILDQREVMEAKSVKGTPAGKLQKP